MVWWTAGIPDRFVSDLAAFDQLLELLVGQLSEFLAGQRALDGLDLECGRYKGFPRWFCPRSPSAAPATRRASFSGRRWLPEGGQRESSPSLSSNKARHCVFTSSPLCYPTSPPRPIPCSPPA